MKKRDDIRIEQAVLTWPNAGSQESVLQGFAETIQGELTQAWKACGRFEWIAFGYLALSGVMIAIFARNLAHPARLVATQALVALIILLLCRAAARSEQRAILSGETLSTKFWHFWRHWYLHLFFLFCFEEMGRLVHLVNPRMLPRQSNGGVLSQAC